MKYSLVTPFLDAQLTEIRSKIRLSMNGIVSGLMAQNGIVYKINYGVSIPRIKEIALSYIPNHELAQRLWLPDIRETMILATLLEPTDQFTPEMAREWVSRFNQIEIVEQACMNLFSKLPFAGELCLEWVHSDKIWIQVTGFILATRIFGTLNHTEMIRIIKRGLDLSSTTELHLYKAIGLCLSRFCRKDKQMATYILKEIEAISQTSSISELYISTEVKQEILILNTL